VGSLGTILSVWAHPDDETYLAAGVMSAARTVGRRVVCASATAGERGTSEPDVWPPERLGRVRRWEAAAAMAVLGVAEHSVGRFPDGDLDRHHARGAEWAGGLIDDVRPDTILTFGPDGQTFHPDHVAVHRWVTQAWEDRGRPARLLYSATTIDHIEAFGDLYERWNVFMTDDRPVGVDPGALAVHLRLDGSLLDRKLAALRAMATQTAPAQELLGPELYEKQAATEAFIDADSRHALGLR
jgi:LmbE family N-acetylglucosaminyl deacetylase